MKSCIKTVILVVVALGLQGCSELAAMTSQEALVELACRQDIVKAVEEVEMRTLEALKLACANAVEEAHTHHNMSGLTEDLMMKCEGDGAKEILRAQGNVTAEYMKECTDRLNKGIHSMPNATSDFLTWSINYVQTWWDENKDGIQQRMTDEFDNAVDHATNYTADLITEAEKQANEMLAQNETQKQANATLVKGVKDVRLFELSNVINARGLRSSGTPVALAAGCALFVAAAMLGARAWRLRSPLTFVQWDPESHHQGLTEVLE